MIDGVHADAEAGVANELFLLMWQSIWLLTRSAGVAKRSLFANMALMAWLWPRGAGWLIWRHGFSWQFWLLNLIYVLWLTCVVRIRSNQIFLSQHRLNPWIIHVVGSVGPDDITQAITLFGPAFFQWFWLEQERSTSPFTLWSRIVRLFTCHALHTDHALTKNSQWLWEACTGTYGVLLGDLCSIVLLI